MAARRLRAARHRRRRSGGDRGPPGAAERGGEGRTRTTNRRADQSDGQAARPMGGRRPLKGRRPGEERRAQVSRARGPRGPGGAAAPARGWGGRSPRGVRAAPAALAGTERWGSAALGGHEAIARRRISPRGGPVPLPPSAGRVAEPRRPERSWLAAGPRGPSAPRDSRAEPAGAAGRAPASLCWRVAWGRGVLGPLCGPGWFRGRGASA